MKKVALMLIIALISCEQKDYFCPDKATVWSGITFVPVPDNYRGVLGYDSIQLIINHDETIRANFCYPNGLVKDSLVAIKEHDTVFMRYPIHFYTDDTITLKIISE